MFKVKIFKKIFNKNTAKIEKNSNNNKIYQGNQLNNPNFLIGNDEEIMKLMSDSNNFDMIQKITKSRLSNTEKAHPLYPHFLAKYDSNLEKIVSTPETKEAIQKYPKHIKGSGIIDLKKYPHLNPNETIWEYIYRTQTILELETTAYKEYLGDMEDPFPTNTFQEGMITKIVPHEFPKAEPIQLICGDISLNMMIRRIPCMEYKEYSFICTTDFYGFELVITINDNNNTSSFNLTKKGKATLQNQLLREKFINNIKTYPFSILLRGQTIIKTKITEKEKNNDLFMMAPILILYIENLIFIENSLDCKFDSNTECIDELSPFVAFLIANSIKNKWGLEKKKFDNTIRIDPQQIPRDILENNILGKDINLYINNIIIKLNGVTFAVDKYSICYKNAQINNLSSIIKNIKRHKNEVLVTFKPYDKKDYVNKYTKFEGIKVIS